MKMNCLSFSSKRIDDSSKSTSTCSTSTTSSQTYYDSLDGDEECTTTSSTKLFSKYDDAVFSIDERTTSPSSASWKHPSKMEKEEEEEEDLQRVRKSKSYSSFENVRKDGTDTKKNKKKNKKIRKSQSHTSFDLENPRRAVSSSENGEDQRTKERKNIRTSNEKMKKIKKKKKKKVRKSDKSCLLLEQQKSSSSDVGEKKKNSGGGGGESFIVDKKKNGTESDFMHPPYQHQQQQQQQLVMMTEGTPQPPEVLPTTTMTTLTAEELVFDVHDDDDDDYDENENKDLELLLLLSERVQTTFAQAPSKNFEYEATIASCFPGGAISNETVVTDVVSVLHEKGYTIQNTHLATSFVRSGNGDAGSRSQSQSHQSCCQLEDNFTSIYQQKHLQLGGLANLFAGTTTDFFNDMMDAQQIQDNDNDNDDDVGYYCLLVFGTHVSLAANGTINKVERNFQDFQPQAVEELISTYAPQLAAADAAGENRMLELLYALYESQDRVLSEMLMMTQMHQQQAQQQAPTGSTSIISSTATGTKHCCRGMAVLGGIQILTEGPNTPDYFHPLRFDFMNYGTIDGEIVVVEDLLDSLTSTTTVRMKTE